MVDGDTVVISDVRLRLNNMDAFESAQKCLRAGAEYRCGDEATAYLINLIASREIRCEQVGTDYYRRPLVICRLGSIDLGREMVRAGWALAEFDPRDYAADQEHARANKLGAWLGTFQRPREWRKQNPRQ